jgi:hypothetical protein
MLLLVEVMVRVVIMHLLCVSSVCLIYSSDGVEISCWVDIKLISLT